MTFEDEFRDDLTNKGTNADYQDIGFNITGHASGNIPDADMNTENAFTYTLAYEDMGTVGDFDFNDVVLKVNYTSGTGTAYVTLCAAGGTLSVKVKYTDNNSSTQYIKWGESQKEEIHDAFGYSSSSMINTTAGGLTVESINQTINVPADFSIKGIGDNPAKLTIEVTKDDGVTEIGIPDGTDKGGAPQCICISGNWEWPTERTHIDVAYPGFGKWGAGYTTYLNWWSEGVKTDKDGNILIWENTSTSSASSN